MPEVVEVRVIAESLNRDLVGREFVSFNYDPEAINSVHKKDIVGYEHLCTLLPLKVVAMSAKGKKIIFWLEGDIFLISSLGMTGSWIWTKSDHSNISFALNDGRILYYNDPRKFGSLVCCFDISALIDYISDIGPCLLNERHLITSELWKEKLRNTRIKNKQIGDYLLDQKRIAGIGNYLKSEILYRSKISPYRTLQTLSDDDIEILRITAFETIDESFAHGGLTIENYWDPYGKKGTYPCRVYSKKLDPSGNKIEIVTLKDQRTTYWCPAIQK